MHGPADKVAQDRKIQECLGRIHRPVLVMSGKGGVGKSTVTVNLASALASRGYKVGIMDVDVHGPNIPMMLGIGHLSFLGDGQTIEPVTLENGIKVASMALAGYDPDEAIIWRGPMKIAMVRQFLSDVRWGDLDYLLVDTPPGTGDEILTVAQTIPNLAGAVVVSTPQGVSVLDSRKSITFARKLNIPVLGVVQNMSGFVCPHCNSVTRIFNSDGALKMAQDMDLPLLGELPLDPSVVQAGDNGQPFYDLASSSPTVTAFGEVVDRLLGRITELEVSGRYNKPLPDPDFRPER